YINGEFKNPIQNQWIDNYNPSTGEIYSLIPNSSAEDVQTAYEAAEKASLDWSETTLQQRSAILTKIASLLTESLELLAKAETMDNGKPLSLSTSVDIPRASSNFQFFANAITQFASEAHESV
ncbi:aldehyde dehydrogenase family protein, partial [Aquimarina celericrescens]|nr:aldehyde dehydrogenase family protein [Aquimarina celericrescens]